MCRISPRKPWVGAIRKSDTRHGHHRHLLCFNPKHFKVTVYSKASFNEQMVRWKEAYDSSDPMGSSSEKGGSGVGQGGGECSLPTETCTLLGIGLAFFRTSSQL